MDLTGLVEARCPVILNSLRQRFSTRDPQTGLSGRQVGGSKDLDCLGIPEDQVKQRWSRPVVQLSVRREGQGDYG